VNYRKLGKSSIVVSEIGLGTAQLANTDGASPGVKPISPETAREILLTALHEGVSFFDTADQYGSAELLLGRLRGCSRNPFIATKAGLRPDGVRDFSEEYLRHQVARSIERLERDHVDLFQLNKPSVSDVKDGRLFDLLVALKAEGKAKLVGMVVGDIRTGLTAIAYGAVDCLQILYNLLYRETEELIEEAGSKGIGVIVRSPLNSGLLSGTYTARTVFRPSDERSRYFQGHEFLMRLRALEDISKDLGLDAQDLLEFSLRFILSNPHVSTVIPGASSVAQVSRYVGSSSLERFEEGELSRIHAVLDSCTAGVGKAFQN
jgi:aryl-alcohol dehydrogenase-like predicted oxidoreductase